MANSVEYIRGINGTRPEFYATIVRIDNTTLSDAFSIPGLIAYVNVGISSASRTLTLQEGSGFRTIVIPASSVNITTNAVTISHHPLYTGLEVVPTNGGGAVPTGLTSGTTYFVISNGGDSISFASSAANAIAGTAIDLTNAGSGFNLDPLFTDTDITVISSTTAVTKIPSNTLTASSGLAGRPGIFRIKASDTYTGVISIYSHLLN